MQTLKRYWLKLRLYMWYRKHMRGKYRQIEITFNKGSDYPTVNIYQ